jgi:acyl-coenzyme A synthetase/AMP-(fatty) acid ligase
VQPLEWAEATGVLAAELIQFCRSHLASFKCPKSVEFERQLPRHATGKLYKRVLRDRYWKGRGSRIS